MKTLLILAFLMVAAHAKSVELPEVHHWFQYKERHGKSYESANEEQRRFNTFLNNKKLVEAHNARYEIGEVSYKLGLNTFADMTNAEFNAIYNNRLKSNVTKTTNQMFKAAFGFKAPTSIDWRIQGYVTGIKDQGQCGSCWAFSTIGSVEGQHFKATNKLVSLSEQQLIDCSTDNYGCEGGLMDLAFQYIIQNQGINTEESYPYTGEDGICHAISSNNGASISGFVDIPSGIESLLTNAIATIGPISVAIDASQFTFQLYESGVYYEPSCSSVLLDHGVVAVGYASENGQDYYIVKNSWGTSWGQQGYIYMARNKNNNCGIATAASYPLV